MWLLWLLFKADCASLVIKTHHAITLGIAHSISKYRGTVELGGRSLQIPA
jgi:hypothetical protein